MSRMSFFLLNHSFPHLSSHVACLLRSYAVMHVLCQSPQLLHQLQNFLNFAYANHMQIGYFYLSFLKLVISRREDQRVTCKLQPGLLFLLCLVLSRKYFRVIIKNQVKGSNGPLHVAIFNYQLINYASV